MACEWPTTVWRFPPGDGSLYTAQTSRVWGGSTEGLQKITWSGKVPMDILHMRLTKKGFELTFTKPVDRETARHTSNYSMTHYYYLYHASYGSPKTDVTPAKVTGVTPFPRRSAGDARTRQAGARPCLRIEAQRNPVGRWGAACHPPRGLHAESAEGVRCKLSGGVACERISRFDLIRAGPVPPGRPHREENHARPPEPALATRGVLSIDPMGAVLVLLCRVLH